MSNHHTFLWRNNKSSHNYLQILLYMSSGFRESFVQLKVLIYFLFFYENICQVASNDYPQLMFSWGNKKK